MAPREDVVNSAVSPLPLSAERILIRSQVACSPLPLKTLSALTTLSSPRSRQFDVSPRATHSLPSIQKLDRRRDSGCSCTNRRRSCRKLPPTKPGKLLCYSTAWCPTIRVYLQLWLRLLSRPMAATADARTSEERLARLVYHGNGHDGTWLGLVHSSKSTSCSSLFLLRA